MASAIWFLLCSILCRVFLKLLQVYFGAQMTGKNKYPAPEWWPSLWILGSCCFEVVSSWPGFHLSPRKEDCRLCGCVAGFLILSRFLSFCFASIKDTTNVANTFFKVPASLLHLPTWYLCDNIILTEVTRNNFLCFSKRGKIAVWPYTGVTFSSFAVSQSGY